MNLNTLKPLGFACLMAFGLAACGGGDKNASAPASGAAPATKTESTLEKIKASGTIVLGHRDASIPFSYIADNPNQPIGYAHDLQMKVVEAVKKELNMPDLKVRYNLVTSQNRIPLVQNGTVDIECGSTTNNTARQKDAAFAFTTYVEEVRIATRTNSGINGIKDLNGKTIVTTTGTTSVQTLRKNKRADGLTFKEVMGKDHADSFLMLETGRADAFIMDGSILAANISKSKAPNDYKIVGEVLSVEPIACMMRKDDPAFKKAVDESIVRQIKDGSLTKLYDKWFLQPIPPNNVKVGLPLSAATKDAWAHPNDKPMEAYEVK